MEFSVTTIKAEETHEWLTKKHYARRVPPISFSFGLYDKDNVLVGICTFGSPCRAYNNGEFVFKTVRVATYELNRLCINEDMPKNTLSFFVSRCLDLMPKPSCIVSYSDHNQGHHGYIYQATNWIYTGLNDIHDSEYIINGVAVHSRTLTGKGITAPKEWADKNGIQRTEQGRKHRYFIFCGNKAQRRKMANDLRFDRQQYPKGDNRRYDSSYKPITQAVFGF